MQKRYETTYTIRGNTSCLCTQAWNEHPSLPCRHPNDSSLRTGLPARISFPSRSQTQRCAAADHGGMRDLKLSQWWCWRFKSPGTSRRVSSTRRPEESSCLYYVGHYSPKERLSLPKRTRVYTEWCRLRRNVPQVFANEWRYHGIDPLTTNPLARKHCLRTATDRLLFDTMTVCFHDKKKIINWHYSMFLQIILRFKKNNLCMVMKFVEHTAKTQSFGCHISWQCKPVWCFKTR